MVPFSLKGTCLALCQKYALKEVKSVRLGVITAFRRVLNPLREFDTTSQVSLEWCDEGLRFVESALSSSFVKLAMKPVFYFFTFCISMYLCIWCFIHLKHSLHFDDFDRKCWYGSVYIQSDNIIFLSGKSELNSRKMSVSRFSWRNFSLGNF